MPATVSHGSEIHGKRFCLKERLGNRIASLRPEQKRLVLFLECNDEEQFSLES